MTWLSTWPEHGIPVYRVHTTEAAAEAHAKTLVDSGITKHATAYQLVLPDEETQQ